MNFLNLSKIEEYTLRDLVITEYFSPKNNMQWKKPQSFNMFYQLGPKRILFCIHNWSSKMKKRGLDYEGTTMEFSSFLKKNDAGVWSIQYLVL